MRQGEGHTRNICDKGAFVDAAICPPIGSSVELQFSLPPLSDKARKMHVQYTGESLRLEGKEQGEHRSGFAITSRKAVWRYEEENNFDRRGKKKY